MLSTKDVSQLERHLKQAAQLYQKRDKIWSMGGALRPTLSLERRLFASLSILSITAEDFLLTNWPTPPKLRTIAQIACLQSNSTEAFRSALDDIQTQINDDPEAVNATLRTLIVASASPLSSEQRDEVIASSLLNRLADPLDCLLWDESSLRICADQCQLNGSARAHLKTTQPLSEPAAFRQALAVDPVHAEVSLMKRLQNDKASADDWLSCALIGSESSRALFLRHTEQAPETLWAAVFDPSPDMQQALIDRLAVPHLNAHAAWVLEQWIGNPLPKQPALTDADNRRAPDNAPLQATLPADQPLPQFPMISGAPKTAARLAAWLMTQPASRQTLGWRHLGQLTGRVWPDLTGHWLHTQLSQLKELNPTMQECHAA